MLGLTPKELGDKRERDPIGVAFLERTIIYRMNKKAEAHEKQRKEMERAKHRKRR